MCSSDICVADPRRRAAPISLKHLINFGKGGRNKGEKEEGEKLLISGNFVSRLWGDPCLLPWLISSARQLRTELPTRLSHRLRDLQELPYIVASNPRMAHVYELYLEAFEQSVVSIRTVSSTSDHISSEQDTSISPHQRPRGQ